MKRPASQFYWGDWLNCQEVRSVSLAARGLWMDMLCYMRQGQPVGYLTYRDGRPITAEQLARMVGESADVVRVLLAELEAAGVPSTTDNGAYFSRRMVRDESEYETYRAGQAEAGKRGAAGRWGSPSQPHKAPQPDPTKIEWGGDASSSSSSPSSSNDVQPSAVCTEPEAGSVPTVLLFPCIGKGASEWRLTSKQITEWEEAYPGIDVLGECRKALVWVHANRRKTARGMAAFLVRWLSNATDRGRGNTKPTSTGRTAGNVGALQRFVARGTVPVANAPAFGALVES